MKKTGKIITGFVVGVLSAAAIICVAVPRVRESIKDFINKLKHDDGKTDDKTDKEKAQEKAHDDDFYQDLDDDEKKDFDDKLNDIVDSDHYKNLDEKGKDELLEKFVESEKVQQELKNDAEDKKPEEIENKISEKQNELENIQKEIEDLKSSGASEEDIAKAEEKQQQVEEEIKSAEQEKAYWETVETVKESVSTNDVFQARNPGVSIRRINGVYKYEGTVYLNGDFIQEEIIDGRSYFSQHNQFFSINKIITGEENYEQILQIISDGTFVQVEKTCVNKNSQEQKDYFEKNKYQIDDWFQYLENHGYTLTIEESWEIEGQEAHPEFIIKSVKDNVEEYYMVTYETNLNKYRTPEISKICPEFWAQLEIERAQTATTSAEAKAQELIDSNTTKDENGKASGLNWNAVNEQRQQAQAKKEAKLALTDTASVMYPDQGMRL